MYIHCTTDQYLSNVLQKIVMLKNRQSILRESIKFGECALSLIWIYPVTNYTSNRVAKEEENSRQNVTKWALKNKCYMYLLPRFFDIWLQCIDAKRMTVEVWYWCAGKNICELFSKYTNINYTWIKEAKVQM